MNAKLCSMKLFLLNYQFLFSSGFSEVPDPPVSSHNIINATYANKNKKNLWIVPVIKSGVCSRMKPYWGLLIPVPQSISLFRVSAGVPSSVASCFQDYGAPLDNRTGCAGLRENGRWPPVIFPGVSARSQGYNAHPL